jgi:peptide/nickel transport system substrate-binding protein
VEIELERPFNELLFNLTLACGSIVDKNAVEKLGKEFGVKGFNGTGPYMFVSWEPRKEVVLKRNPNYRWGSPIYENPGPAKVENVIWRVVPEESTRVAAMMANQADLLQAVPAWALKQFSAAPNLKVHHSDQFNWLWYVGFKVDKPSVSDPKVRRALVAAVDQKEIVEKIFFGTMEPAYTYIKPSAVDFEKAVLDLVPKSDPQYAKKLLDEAGWKMGPDGFRYKDGKKLTVLLYSFNSYTKMLEAVQGYLRAVGVDLQLQLFDATVVWGKLGTQEYDAFSMSFPYFSAGDMLNIYFRSQNIPAPNRMNWKDEETDKLLDEGRAALTPEARAAAYSKVLRKVHEAAVWIPISHELVDVVGNKRVSGVKLNGAYGCALYKGLDLEIKK